MSEPRRAINFFGGGIPIGVMVAAVVAPYVIGRIQAPIAGSEALCNCRDIADRFIQDLWTAYGVGAVAGALGGLALWYMLLRRRRAAARPAPEG